MTVDTNAVSHSQQLRAALATSGLPLTLMYSEFWGNDRVGELVVPFLVLMHQVVRASVPLMEAASAKAAETAPRDPLAARLQAYMDAHIEEERHHDTWIMEDLESAGLDRDSLLAQTPDSQVAALVGAQYYWIYHHHPIALLGYIRLLEGKPPSAGHIERLRQVSGLPESTFRTYQLHGELDPDHLQEFDTLLDALDLNQEQFELVRQSAVYTAHQLANCLGTLIKRNSE
ncbi:iron-containing redox enzyme family protein [Seongchinamella unica]|nr:iron-containing redox enzyme family protein [Seongchinamella unica]